MIGHRFVLLASLAGVILASGCSTDRPSGKARNTPSLPVGVRATDIAVISLISTPVALNLDEAPGVDGFQLKIFASDWTHPKPVAFPEGTLKLVQYEGRLTPESQPMESWEFSLQQLRPFQFRSSLGIGYEMVVRWSGTAPNCRNVSIVAEFIPAKGETLRSKPTLITVQDLPGR